MVSLHAHPVVLEALELGEALRVTRRAAVHDARQLSVNATSVAACLAAIDRGEAAAEQAMPRIIADHLAEYRALLVRWNALWAEHPALLGEARNTHLDAMRQAIALHRAETTIASAHEAITEVTSRAAASARLLTPRERALVANDVPRATPRAASLDYAVDPDAVVHALGQLQLKQASSELRQGLLLTDQMRRIEQEALPALHRGDPLLLIGETGGAKTALAEHLARRVVAEAPEFVSGYGDITSAQVIGSHELRSASGATVTEFVAGPLVRAMTEGRPIILDEINAMPPEFLKRLNRILQLGPGDHFSVQENAGASLRIAPGFVILATANEQSRRRYRGIEQLSAELVNRFGVGAFRVLYPDAHLAYGDLPRENLLLASAAAADRDGRLMPGITTALLERVARVAFISQQVFAGSQAPGFADFVSTEHAVDGEPGLEESVIAPRTLVSIVRTVARSAGALTMEHTLARFVDGVMHREDRHVLGLILQSQGFHAQVQR